MKIENRKLMNGAIVHLLNQCLYNRGRRDLRVFEVTDDHEYAFVSFDGQMPPQKVHVDELMPEEPLRQTKNLNRTGRDVDRIRRTRLH